MKIRALSLALMAAGLSGQVSAAGYYVDEQSALRLGNAFSGGAASANDASTAYYNPAGLVRVKRELATNISAISVNSSSDSSATTVGGAPVDGSDPDAQNVDYLPTIYFASPIGKESAMGFFVNAPYATGAEVGDDTNARYQATESNITGIDLGVSFATRLNKNLSVGASVIAQYMEAYTAVAVNTPAACAGAAMDLGFTSMLDIGTFCATNFNVDVTKLGSSEQDGSFEMEGDSIDYGFDVGILYEISPRARFGMNYKSAIKHTLEGDATATFTAETQAFIPTTKADGEADLTTPEVLNMSYFHQLGRLSLQGDFSWSRWSRFDQLEVKSDNATIQSLAAEPQQYNWTESYRIAFGGDYKLNNVLTLRSGFAFDQTPIDDDDTKVDFAFDDYKALSFGLSYAMGAGATLDLAMQHTLTQERSIDQNELDTAGAHLTGDVTTEVNSFALGLRMAL